MYQKKKFILLYQHQQFTCILYLQNTANLHKIVFKMNIMSYKFFGEGTGNHATDYFLHVQ